MLRNISAGAAHVLLAFRAVVTAVGIFLLQYLLQVFVAGVGLAAQDDDMRGVEDLLFVELKEAGGALAICALPSSLAATTKCQGCRLVLEGLQRRASLSCCRVSGAIFLLVSKDLVL